MRLDIYLTSNGYADSRRRAKLLVTEGFVTVNGKTVTKASLDINESDEIVVSGDPIGYVSRGALKLKAAFETFSLSADGVVAIDVGASTGGFTEYLLNAGAKKVYAVDSGTDQLAEKLRSDERVVSMEKYNARNLLKEDFPIEPSLAVMDVSFISQTLIIPSLVKVLAKNAKFVSLIKPQFEAGRDAIGKGGIVKNPVSKAMSIKKVIDCAKENGFELCGLIKSPIKGGDGNEEFLAYFASGENASKYEENIELLISKIVNV